MARFEQTWIDTGIAAVDIGAVVRQLILPELPPGQPQLDALAAVRLAPCNELAPPAVLPAECVQVFIGTRHDGRAWAATVVTGGDCTLDAQAAHVADITGRVHAPGDGAVVTALLDAAIAALAHLDGTVPAVLRLPVSPPGAFERAALLIARMWDPPQRLHRERRHSIRPCSRA